MIQRIQTIFLLVVTALAVGLFFFPVFVIKSKDAVPYMIQSSMMTSVVVALTGVLAFISIFLYKNRQRQMMLCRLNLLLIAAAIGLIIQASDTSSFPKGISIEYSFAIYFGPAQIVFDLLALYFIRKDDKLVRSADRLR